MTLYKCTIFKRNTSAFYPAESWSNVYTIEESTALEAQGVAASAAILEADAMFETAVVYRINTVDPAATTDRRSIGVNYPGTRPVAGLGSVLPLFNTVRVIFSDDVARPESKFLRNTLAADNVELGQVSAELVTELTAGYLAGILALNQIVGPSGETFTTGLVQKAVQMRQLGWSRRSRPGFKRGYVPV